MPGSGLAIHPSLWPGCHGQAVSGLEEVCGPGHDGGRGGHGPEDWGACSSVEVQPTSCLGLDKEGEGWVRDETAVWGEGEAVDAL